MSENLIGATGQHVANWIPNDNQSSKKTFFTDDELIQAYLQGRNDGASAKDEILNREFKKNLARCGDYSGELKLKIEALNVSIKNIYLRVNGINSFDSLVFVDKDRFVSDDFRQVFTIARDIKARAASDNLELNFLYAPFTDSFNHSCVKSDGYLLKYEK